MDEIRKWASSPVWDNERSKGRYLYPLKIDWRTATQEGLRLTARHPSGTVFRIGPYLCGNSPDSHVGPFRHCIDFHVPDGTPVRAAKEGKVIELIGHHERWGETEEFRDYLNFISIWHDNGEFTQYCHLQKASAAASGIELGGRVKRGQIIARTGKTGWTDCDHLHFGVFRAASNASPFKFKSLRPRWSLLPF